MDLKNQRRMAASILKCGETRVWIDPNRLEDVAEAITRADMRTAIASGAIAKLPRRGVSRGRTRHRAAQRKKGRRRGPGSRKGTANARRPSKRDWIVAIRTVRDRLRELRDAGKIDRHTYRRYYRLAKGGVFRDRPNLTSHLRAAGLLKEA